jgi:transposase
MRCGSGSSRCGPRRTAAWQAFRDHRQVVEGIVFRYRTGVPWRDLPERFGLWQTVGKRHHRFATDGTWRRVLAAAQAAGEIDWNVSVDSTIVRAHQHSATAKRDDRVGPAGTQGAASNDKNPRCCRDEPGDHAGQCRDRLEPHTVAGPTHDVGISPAPIHRPPQSIGHPGPVPGPSSARSPANTGRRDRARPPPPVS